MAAGVAAAGRLPAAMSAAAYNVIVEADDNRDDLLARDIGRVLCEAYPGHQWHVRIGKGVLIIKHMRITSKWGIARRYDRLTWDAKARKREVVRAAGELLERAGLTRGRVVEGEVAKTVDGVPQKDVLPPMISRMVTH